MNMQASALLRYVNRDLRRDSTPKVYWDTPLFEDGLIDSLKILQLIAFVEAQTGRRLADREIVMEKFRSVQAIAEHFLSAP